MLLSLQFQEFHDVVYHGIVLLNVCDRHELFINIGFDFVCNQVPVEVGKTISQTSDFLGEQIIVFMWEGLKPILTHDECDGYHFSHNITGV